jgi:hypothetical protein
MKEIDKLRVLLPHWIEHNGEHAGEFRGWVDRAGPARDALLDAARLLEEANARLQEALERVGGASEQEHHHESRRRQ